MNSRRAARAVFLTPDHTVLLMNVEEPLTGLQVWITPGGGLESDETDEEGLRREIGEETGAKDFLLGPAVWTRRHDFTWNGQDYSQREVYYLVCTDCFQPILNKEVAPAETSAFRGFRWWSIDDIAESEEKFAPRNLHHLLQQLVQAGPPATPIDAGV